MDTEWSDTGVAVQLNLVEDSLETYPDVSVLWGAPPAVEAAVGAVDNAVLGGNLLRKGDVKAFPTLAPVLEARIAVDTAVRALQGKDFHKAVMIVPEMGQRRALQGVSQDADVPSSRGTRSRKNELASAWSSCVRET